MGLIGRGELQLDPKPPGKPHLTSWNDFCRLVLEIIAQQSPCSQPTLFLIATARGLQNFGDGTLSELKKLLRRCVQELKARGLVQIDGAHLVLTPARGAEEKDSRELTAEVPTDQTPQVQVTGKPKLVHEVIKERIIAAPAPNAENEDILELKAEASTSQTQQKTQAQVTNSLKPAREPTRDRIIAASAPNAEDEDILELTTEVELHEDEDILELTTEVELHEVEDILELTAELELHPPPGPAKRDEAVQRANEPTREEIIAAMLRFVSDA
jgi:hypothetical protein